MTRSIWLDQQAQEEEGQKSSASYDVVIIGGGLIGAATAYYLTNRKNLSVCLVESNQVGRATSARNAGFVLRGIQTYYDECVRKFGRESAEYIYRFAEENQQLLREFHDQSSVDISLEECGSYILAASIEELEELEESHELMREDSFEVELLKEDPLDRGYYGALYSKRDLGINPYKLTQALIEASRVNIIENEHILRVESLPDDGGLEVIGTKTSFSAERVLLTTNAYSSLIDPWFQKIYHPVRGQILVTQPLNKEIVDKICYANYGWVYFRQLANKRFMLGGRRQMFREREIGFADIITPEVQSALEEYMKDFFEDVVGAPIDYRFSGVMAYTNDGIPVVDEHPHLKGLFYALGFNGHGLGYGLRMAKHLIAHALDGEDPGVFSASRKTLLPESHSEEQGP